jgi:hypothetical protein
MGRTAASLPVIIGPRLGLSVDGAAMGAERSATRAVLVNPLLHSQRGARESFQLDGLDRTTQRAIPDLCDDTKSA